MLMSRVANDGNCRFLCFGSEYRYTSVLCLLAELLLFSEASCCEFSSRDVQALPSAVCVLQTVSSVKFFVLS